MSETSSSRSSGLLNCPTLMASSSVTCFRTHASSSPASAPPVPGPAEALPAVGPVEETPVWDAALLTLGNPVCEVVWL